MTTSLKRSLGLVPAIAIILANVIGTGVFVKARVMTCNVGEPGLVMLAYALGGVLALFGSLAYAELSTMMPHAGGAMNYLRTAYGLRWGFLYGWMEFVAGTSAASAALAILFVVFLNDLLGGALSPLALRVLPLAVIALTVGLNLLPVRRSGHLMTVLTAIKVALVVGIGVAAFVWGDGSWGHFGASGAAASCADVPSSARFGLAGFGAAMIGAIWSYQGWDQLVLVAGEVRRPSWTLPRALVGGAALVTVLYLFVNAAYFYVLTPAAIAGVSPDSSVAREVMARLFGAGVASLLAAGLMLSSFGSLYTGVLVVPRVTFGLAQDGLLPAAFARVGPATRIPWVGVLAFGAWVTALTASGTFEILSDVSVVVLLAFLGLTVSTVFVLRRTQPDAERPVRAWGYPVVPALYLLAVVLLIGNTFVATPGRALAGFGLVALGLPVYAYYARRRPDLPGDDRLLAAPEPRAAPPVAPPVPRRSPRCRPDASRPHPRTSHAAPRPLREPPAPPRHRHRDVRRAGHPDRIARDGLPGLPRRARRLARRHRRVDQRAHPAVDAQAVLRAPHGALHGPRDGPPPSVDPRRDARRSDGLRRAGARAGPARPSRPPDGAHGRW